MVYHVLTELAGFSDFSGGGISRWVANILRYEDGVVVCRSYDTTWGFPEERILLIEPKKYHSAVSHPASDSPKDYMRGYYNGVTTELSKRVSSRDIVWVHNRPQLAIHLQQVLKVSGGTVVLHLHTPLHMVCRQDDYPHLAKLPIVFVSDFLHQETQSACGGLLHQTFTLYNGADGALFHPLARMESRTRQTPTIVFFGRLDPRKGAHVLMQAMTYLGKQGVEARCQVVGAPFYGGSSETEYSVQIRARHPANVEFSGYLHGERLAALVRDADIACIPSNWNDPFPLVVVEAMASGLPVVASRVGGIPEALQYGGGVLVRPGSAEDLANALRDLCVDKERRLRLGDEALRSFLGHFQWSHVRSGYVSTLAAVTRGFVDHHITRDNLRELDPDG